MSTTNFWTTACDAIANLKFLAVYLSITSSRCSGPYFDIILDRERFVSLETSFVGEARNPWPRSFASQSRSQPVDAMPNDEMLVPPNLVEEDAQASGLKR
jgi:hypothetical protein